MFINKITTWKYFHSKIKDNILVVHQQKLHVPSESSEVGS